MKHFLGIFLFSFAFIAQAQPLPQSQCPQAGVLLSRDFLGLSGDAVQSSYRRDGAAQIPTTQDFAGNLTARTYKVFNERSCVAKVHNYQQQVCSDVPADIAIGRGNNLFRSFFDLNITPLKRAEMFSQTVKFGLGATQANRITTANEVVKHMTRIAISTGIPKSWDQLGLMLKQVVAEGFMTQAEFDDIFLLNAPANKANLGFQPLNGVQINEGKGNGKLARIFDLTLTLLHRAQLIKRTINGVSDAASMTLAKSFIEFASVNGVPATWNQFLLMVKDSALKNAISQAEFINITETLEAINRANLGFEVNYFICKMESRQHFYNAVIDTRRQDYHQDVSKSFRINVSNAPLLQGESEEVVATFNGLNEMQISASQNYNNFTIERSTVDQIEFIKLVGARKRVTPPNAIVAQVLHQGSKVNVNLQNTAFNPLVGGKVVVEVRFFEKVAILSDKHLGTKIFELTNGDKTAFTPNVQMIKSGRKAYVQLYMKVVGSIYYNEELSTFKEFRE